MRLSAVALRRSKTAVLVAFFAAMSVYFAYLWLRSGGDIPTVTTDRYRVTATFDDIQNLQENADVRIAGVRLGRVKKLARDGTQIRGILEFEQPNGTPLHEGATVQLRAKSVLEETYVDVLDGTGGALRSGARLPAGSQRPSVQLDDVLNSLDAPARAALSSLIQRLDLATAGRGADLSATLSGLGKVGREGHDAVDILAAQSADLKELTAQADKLLQLLDEGQGRVVRIVDAADRVAGAVAGQSSQVTSAVRLLPGVLDEARNASAPLRSLTSALAPLAPPLQAAAPDLSGALTALAPATKELRATLPLLDTAFDRAPAALTRAGPVASDLQLAIPPLRVLIADLNPMLGYLAPYTPDITAAVANVTDALHNADPDGRHYLRLTASLAKGSMGDTPINNNGLPPDRSNAYPPPGGAENPQPFSGPVPRVERDPEE